GWWELRRIPYNLIVGCVGIVTCVFIATAALASEIVFGKEFGLPDPPIFAVLGVLLYAIAANLCYTGGWIAELLVRKLWPDGTDRFAVWIFSLGVIFSILVTLSPSVLIGVSGVFQLWHHFHHAV